MIKFQKVFLKVSNIFNNLLTKYCLELKLIKKIESLSSKKNYISY